MARVLVVEDDPPIASVLERGLGLAGYEVESAADGPSGLARWAEGGWSAIVLGIVRSAPFQMKKAPAGQVPDAPQPVATVVPATALRP